MDGAVAMLEQVPALAFSLADLLSSHSVAGGGKRHRHIMLRLLECLAGAPDPAQPLYFKSIRFYSILQKKPYPTLILMQSPFTEYGNEQGDAAFI